VHLVDFIIRIYHDARSHEYQTLNTFYDVAENVYLYCICDDMFIINELCYLGSAFVPLTDQTLLLPWLLHKTLCLLILVFRFT